MSTTAAATAAIASVQASNAQAARAERADCELAMRGFENDGATLQARQHYAQCVQLVHPVQVDDARLYHTNGMLLGGFGLCAVTMVLSVIAMRETLRGNRTKRSRFITRSALVAAGIACAAALPLIVSAIFG